MVISGGEGSADEKGPKGTFGGDGNVLYFDLGDGYMDVYLCSHFSICILKCILNCMQISPQ